MALEQEPLADAIERDDGSVRFTATAGEENGPYSMHGYVLVRGALAWRAEFMEVQGKTITVRFPRRVEAGDVVEVPDAG